MFNPFTNKALAAFTGALALTVLNANAAYDFKVNGLCFNKIKNAEGQVELTFDATGTRPTSSDPSYLSLSGEIVVPSRVSYEGVDYQVVKVHTYAFSYNSTITSVEFPASVTTMGQYVFQYATGIKTVGLSDAMKEVPGYTFDSSSLESIDLPAEVAKLGRNAFKNCKALKHLGMSNTVIASVEQDALRSCEALDSLVFPNTLKTIAKGACYGSGFSYLDLGDSVETIGDNAFYSCKNFDYLYLPASLKSLGKTVFQSTSELSHIISLGEKPATCTSTSLTGITTALDTLYVPKEFIPNYETATGWKAYSGYIEPYIAAKKLTLDKENIDLPKGESIRIEKTVEPADALERYVSWRSSDEKVATVDNTGLVTGIAEGQAIIFASTRNGLTATVTVNVKSSSGLEETVISEEVQEGWYNINGIYLGKEKPSTPGLYILASSKGAKKVIVK